MNPMYTYVEVIQGPGIGTIFRVSPKMKLGSGLCEIQLPDPTLPEIHSQFLLDSEDQLVLVCNNIVYEILQNGKSLKKLTLKPNQIFQIGGTSLRVISSPQALDLTNYDPKAFQPESAFPADDLLPEIDGEDQKTTILNPNFDHEFIETQILEKAPLPPKESPSIPLRSSKLNFINQLKSLLNRSQLTISKNKSVLSFKSPFQIRVLLGPQADDIFVVSWGPRQFGPASLEFPIEYPPYPGILFTLTPNDLGEIFFSTDNPTYSKVSGKKGAFCVIEYGDQIVAGGSTLVVEPLKD